MGRKRLTIGPLKDRPPVWDEWLQECDLMHQAWIETMLSEHARLTEKPPMTQVQTTKGLIDRDLLYVKDVVSDEPNARVIATEWFLGDELVRRDVAVSILSGHALAGEQAEI